MGGPVGAVRVGHVGPVQVALVGGPRQARKVPVREANSDLVCQLNSVKLRLGLLRFEEGAQAMLEAEEGGEEEVAPLPC
eukprot:397697-Rhodomonas_salina.1